MTTWYIERDPSEGWLVRRNRARRVKQCPSEDAALRTIRKDFKIGDKVILVEEDGYRTVITRRVPRTRSRR